MSDQSGLISENYDRFLQDLKERIRSAQVRASLAINQELMVLYWRIGQDILTRQSQEGWGAKVIEFHLDLDGKGEEYASGHCWLPDQIGAVIQDVNKAFLADGNGIKEPVPSELADRLWRADPSDGLRPLKELRAQWK